MFEVVVVLGLVLLVASRKKSKVDGGGNSYPQDGGTGGTGGASGGGCWDGVPEPLKSQWKALVADPNTPAGALVAAAQIAAASGHKNAAECLLKSGGGGTPSDAIFLKVQEGHMPFYVAEYYTGQGARFKEFEPLNPHLLPFKKTNGIWGYAGWVPGATVQIPPLWSPNLKPVPPPLQKSPPLTVPGGGDDGDDWEVIPEDEDIIDMVVANFPQVPLL